MAMTRGRWALVALLIVAGLYLLIFHADPLPANHEAIGLGKLHVVHDALGIGLILIASMIWYTERKKVAEPAA